MLYFQETTSPQSQLVSLGGLGLSQLFNVADGGTSGRRGKLQLMYKVQLKFVWVENGNTQRSAGDILN